MSDLDVDVVLERVLEAACELTGARYAAIGVLDRARGELERFVTAGVDDPTRQQIGVLPRGRGVLGELIADPRPLRLGDVGAHPRSYGFPSGHPPMKTFLGVPVLVAGDPFGNVYLTEKRDGEEFTDEDEHAVVRLAQFAGVAIDHARRYSGVDTQRAQLNRTVQALDATVEIARAIGGQTDLEMILELVAKRGRALVSARALVIEHDRGGEMVVAAGGGELPAGVIGQTVDVRRSLASAALRTASTLRLEDEPNRVRFERHGLGRLGFRADAGLVVPLIFRGQGHGVLIALDRLKDGPAFTSDDQRLLEAFATSVAIAIATASSVELERDSQRIAAAEQERARWAYELQDGTLQNLAALRVGLAAQLREDDPDTLQDVVREAVGLLEAEIANLRSLISELRPTVPDDIGVHAAIEGIVERARRDGLKVALAIDLGGGEAEPNSTELEIALYRITQEALTNARKHGGAHHVQVQIQAYDRYVRLTVDDDGRGFDPDTQTDGFGLHSMREHAQLLGGTLQIKSTPGRGTQITVDFPTGHAIKQRAS
ncbi:MAG: GAF domain-containing sensor histidine kinase [Solirubrobacteraceae bacterium]